MEFVDGPEGRLEASLWLPEDGTPPRAACVVCHPHPEHGGTMDTTVVFRIARGLRAAGVASLRFNFRGVGKSEGAYSGATGPGGEEDDVLSALGALAARFPGLELWAAGFSFGARTVAGALGREAAASRMLLVALPVLVQDCGALDGLEIPGLVVQGEWDDFGNLSALEAGCPGLYPGLERIEIEGADHFFRKRTHELLDLVRDVATRWLEECA